MTEPIAAAEVRSPRAAGVAPVWHVVVLMVWLLGFSAIGGFHVMSISAGKYAGVLRYVLSAGWEWLTVGFIALSLRRGGMRLRDLIGGELAASLVVLLDVGLAVGFLIVADMVLAALALAIHAQANQNVMRVLPGTRLELAAFLLLCATAGICEELIFRGYLQRQLTALTGSAAAGLVLQGVAFGAAHGYQGIKGMGLIVVFGCMFGGLAQWRKSLRAGMGAHFLQDSIIGVAGFFVRR